jgi:hypothetical protein
MEVRCPDPKATVRAANVKATFDAFKFSPTMGRKLVERHQLNFADLKPDAYILVQRWLDALKEIQEQVGPMTVRSVGASIVDNADIPPIFPDTESLLLALNDLYKKHHRGDVGVYVISQKPDKAIEIRCQTPYPRMFEWGLIEGFCKNQRFKHKGKFDVEYVEGPAGSVLTCVVTARRIA